MGLLNDSGVGTGGHGSASDGGLRESFSFCEGLP